MSLIIWMDFWDWDGAPQSISATTVPLSIITTGAARGKSTPNNTYQMLPEEYWEDREATLTADAPKRDPALPVQKEDVAAPPAKPSDEERSGLLDSLRNAGSLDELKSISAQLRG